MIKLLRKVTTIVVVCLYSTQQVIAERPNVLIIFADDVGTGDVPGYWKNQRKVLMPNLHQLVANGTTFTDAHSTPLCAPSRYVLLSGNYVHRGEKVAGTWTANYDQGNQFRKNQRSIAQEFRDNGYNTAMFGKWHLGGKIPLKEGAISTDIKLAKHQILSDENHDWTKPIEQGPWDIGFDTSYVTLSGIQGPPYKFLRNGRFEGTDEKSTSLWKKGKYQMPHGKSIIAKTGEGSKDWDSTAYNMILVNETEKFLDDHLINRREQPFFTYVSLGSVHGPHSPPDKYIDGTLIAGKHATTHLDLLDEMDKIVGSLVSILDQRQLTNNTIILFTSDNGGGNNSGSAGHQSAGPLRGDKGTIYEGGSRVPMTFRWDNVIPKGETRSSHFVGLNDIYTTLCDLVGIKKKNRYQAVDSISFADYIFNNDKTSNLRDNLGTWLIKKKTGSAYQSMRMGNLKLVHKISSNTFELYDLSKDVNERNNIISDVDEETVKAMYRKLREIGPCRDRKWPIYISKLRKKLPCHFFQMDKSRCNEHPEGWLKCPMSCADSPKFFC